MKNKYIIRSFLFCLFALNSFGQQTSPDRPAWINESDWLPLTKDLGLVIYETRKSSAGVVWNAIHYYEEEIKRLGKDPKNAAAVLFFQDRIAQLRKQESNMPGIAESSLMARKGREMVHRQNVRYRTEADFSLHRGKQAISLSSVQHGRRPQ